MKIEFEVTEERLAGEVAKELTREFLYGESKIILDKDKRKIAGMSTLMVKRYISDILKENWSEIESIVMQVAREFLANNAKHKDGRLKKAIEKALNELEDGDGEA